MAAAALFPGHAGSPRGTERGGAGLVAPRHPRPDGRQHADRIVGPRAGRRFQYVHAHGRCLHSGKPLSLVPVIQHVLHRHWIMVNSPCCSSGVSSSEKIVSYIVDFMWGSYLLLVT